MNVVAHDPEIELTVSITPDVRVTPGRAEAPTATLEGPAVALVEGLSFRGPPPAIDDEHRWMITGLDEAFDLAG